MIIRSVAVAVVLNGTGPLVLAGIEIWVAISFSLNHSLSHRKERVPDVFTGTKGSLKDWLRHFETCVRWNGWDYAERGVNLAMSLRGNAQQVLGELSVHELEDFDEIKAALLLRKKTSIVWSSDQGSRRRARA